MESQTDSKTQVSKLPVGKLLSLVIGAAFIIFHFKLHWVLQAKKAAKIPRPVPVATKPKITTVTSLGRLEPKGEIIEISASAGAEGNVVRQILVEPGTKVKAGDTIAILDSRDRLAASLEGTKKQVAVAQANLAKVKAGAKKGEILAQKAAISRLQTSKNNNVAAQQATLSRLKAELNNAKIEYQRYRRLFKNGAVSASEQDSYYLDFTSAQQQVAEAQANLNRIQSSQQEQVVEAQANLNRITEVRPVDVAVAEAEVRSAQAAVDTAQAELDRAYIKSSQAGTAIEILTHPGEAISNTKGIVRIGQTDEMYAVAEVYESDVAKIKLGQRATITSDAIAKPLQGTVDRIGLEIERQEVVNTDPTANIDAKIVEVKVRLDPASSQQVAGLTNLLVDVTIELERQQIVGSKSL